MEFLPDWAIDESTDTISFDARDLNPLFNAIDDDDTDSRLVLL